MPKLIAVLRTQVPMLLLGTTLGYYQTVGLTSDYGVDIRPWG